MKHIAVPIDLQWPLRRHHEVYAGIQTYANAHHADDWTLIPDNFPEAVIMGELPGPCYDAVIGRLSLPLQEFLAARQIPAVNSWFATSEGKVPVVIPDVAANARLAIDHFAARGLRRVAHVGVRNHLSVKREGQAFQEAARERGFPCSLHKCNDEVELDIERWRSFCKRVNGWLKRWEPPIGVMVHYDSVCRLLATLATRSGWKIPDQLSLLGTGNNTIICESVTPSLSSVQMCYHRNGYEAARLLDNLMNGGELPSAPIFIPPAEIAMRRSTDVFAVPDARVAAALRYMAENCDRALSVGQIATAVNTGRRTLERRFRECLGRSILNELNRLRVERMKRLLVETDDPLKLLVGQAGFGSAEQMRLVFREFTGMRPTDYRQGHSWPTSH